MFSTAFVLSAILVMVASQKEVTCPPKTDIAPCTCQIVTPREKESWITCGYISSLSELTTLVKKMEGYEIDKFVLDQSGVGYIPSNLFLLTRIKEIIIKSMTLSNIASPGENPFQGQERTLESIAIRRCKLNSTEGIDWKRIDNLNSLESLELFKMNLSDFPARWFKFGSNSLRFVYLMENGIKEIDEDAFSAATGLVLINMSENKIKRLKRSMFPMPAEMLTYFHFDDNEITFLPETLFTSMTALKRVSFANNRLRAIEEYVWKPKFSQLTHLDLQGNKIQCDCHIEWTVNALKPDYYYGECENAIDGKSKKFTEVQVSDIHSPRGCLTIYKPPQQKKSLSLYQTIRSVWVKNKAFPTNLN